MVSFHDVRLNVDVEQGAKGGPMFHTTILPALSGEETRNQDWQYGRMTWDISYGMRNRAPNASDSGQGYYSIVSFFYARAGRTYGFRFKDWTDFTSGDATAGIDFTIPANRAIIGTGDGSNKIFQITKTYTDGTFNYVRKITRPVAGTVVIYKAGVLQTNPANYTLGGTGNSVVTFVAAPAGAASIEAGYQFDVPVRFDVDALDMEVTMYDAIKISGLKIVELKE
jgi:uncharacterized protein (TIGR02217 family)